MSAQHTPGPYQAHTDGRTWWVQTPAPERIVIAGGLTEPNALLIAAVPELKAGANAVLDAFENDVIFASLTDAQKEALRSLEAALSKAEGRL